MTEKHSPAPSSGGLERRKALLAAVRDLLVEGSARPRIIDVAERAGVAQGTFYIYFSRLDDAVATVAGEVLDAVGDAVQAAVDGRRGVDAVHAALTTYAYELRERGTVLRKVGATSGERNSVAAHLDRTHARVAILLARAVGAAVDAEPSDRLDAAVDAVGWALASMAEGAAQRPATAHTTSGEVLTASTTALKWMATSAIDALRHPDRRGELGDLIDPLLSPHAPPDKPAIIFGERTITYNDLRDRVSRAAAWLRGAGAAPGDRVALLLENSVAALEIGLAARWSGITLVPMNTHWLVAELRAALSHAQATAIVFDDAHRSLVDALGRAWTERLTLLPLGSTHDHERYESSLQDQVPATGPGQDASSVFWSTSGTTGPSKIIERHETRAERTRHLRFLGSLLETTAEDVILVTGALHHVPNYLMSNLALLDGSTLVLTRSFEPAEFVELVEHHRVSVAHVVPTMLHRLMRLSPDETPPQRLETLRALVHTAAPCSPALKKAAIERFGPVLVEYYGTAEIGGTIIGAEEWLRRPGSVGRAWSPHTTVAIVDDDGAPLPPHAVGNVVVGDDRRVPFRYLGDDAEVPFLGGFFVTGDLGSIDPDGYLYLAARRDDVIVSGGIKIYPHEVETVLNAQPGIADSVVVGLPNEEWGEVVTAGLEFVPDADVDIALVRERVRSQLAHYKCPRIWVPVDEVPRDKSGKLQRWRFRASPPISAAAALNNSEVDALPQPAQRSDPPAPLS